MKATRSPNERLAVLEQKVAHMDKSSIEMSAKVDEMHAILLQARGVRWAIMPCPAWWDSSRHLALADLESPEARTNHEQARHYTTSSPMEEWTGP